MTDTKTACRKRAEKWVRERAQIEDRANWFTVDTAYLAGAREEAEIKDAEIAALRERLSEYQRAVLWLYGWINQALGEQLTPMELAAVIEDDKWYALKRLVGAAAD